MVVGCMAWRIEDQVDLNAQLAWLSAHRFAAVAFWTCAGEPGVWQGFEPRDASAEDIARLQRALEPFLTVDLHAAVPLGVDCPELEATIRFGGRLRARTVTAHLECAAPPDSPVRDALLPTLARLNRVAAACGVRLGLELTRDYDLALRHETPNVGLTLDVGHVSLADGAGYRDFGSVPGLIHHLGPRLFHVHVHDCDGTFDHLHLGAGDLDWPALIRALRSVDYKGVLCLELNPDRASPEQLLESRDRLEALLSTP